MLFNQSELNTLVNALLDGTISVEQHARLQEILRADNSALKEYFAYIDIHLGMKELEELPDDDMIPQGLRKSDLNAAPQRRSRHRSWIAISVCVCSVALIAAWGSWKSLRALKEHAPVVVEQGQTENQSNVVDVPAVAPESPTVRLTQVANVELLLEYVPEVGAPLRLGHEYVLVKGLMELTFANGAIAILQSPAVFTVTSASQLEMKIGRCSVYAGEGAKGFEVITPQSRVVDLGTRFSVVANESGSSDVQVIEGAVEVHPRGAGKPWSMLLEGDAVRSIGATQPLKPIEFDANQYRGQLPDRVISYIATEEQPGQGVRDLASVSVQRGGQVVVYPVEDLIGINVVHFAAFSKSSNAATDGRNVARYETLLSDNVALNSGLTNFDHGPGPYLPAEDFKKFRERFGLGLQFQMPVKNGPGPDVVLFEVQSSAYPAAGDRFYVSPIENGQGLRTHLIERFDVSLNSENARKIAPVSSISFESPIRSIEDFSRVSVVRTSELAVPFYALAVGIDFSDLGYPPGADVGGLFLEDAVDDDHISIDPVFIGGFPDAADTNPAGAR